MTENERQLQMSMYVNKKLKPLQYEMQIFRESLRKEHCSPLVEEILDDWMLQLEAMRADIELLEKVANEHSEALERLEAARVKAEK